VDMQVSADWVRAMSDLFDETGDVKSHQGVRPDGTDPPNRIMDRRPRPDRPAPRLARVPAR
jgi:hypothetical protein